jgi:MFS family permease
VWAIISVFSIGVFTGFGPYMTLGATISIEHWDTRAVYGILASVMGVGTIVGALIGFRWRPRYPMRTGMLLTLPWPAFFVVFALGLPVALLVVIAFFAGLGIMLFGIWWETALAERVPPHMLSRVTAYDWMGSLALLPIGYVLAGPLGEALGATEVLAVGGAIALAALLCAFLVRDVRQLERL